VCAWRSQRGADECNGRREIREDQLSAHPNHTIAEPRELAITAAVRRAAARVIAAINLNDELDTGRTEVSDEARTDGYLATKADTELARVERGPEACLPASD
jgi:hypothetical protein